MSKAAVSSTNLMLITAKTITPSFAPWSTPPFRVCQSDRVPPILTACYRLVRKAAIHFRRTGWISSLASSCIRGVVNKMKSLCEISEEQSSRSLTTIHRFINSLQYVQKGICCRMVWLSSEIEFNQFFSQMFCFGLSSITEQLEWLRRKLQGGQTKVHSSALQVCNAVRLVWMSKSFTAVTTNTRPRMFLFVSGWNLSFRGRQSTVSMVFSRALTEKVPSSLNEGRRKSTRIISHDDHAFNFIYLIKMKDYIVKTTRSLRAEWVRAIDNFVYMMTSSKCRPGTILENLYPRQNFVPVFL